MLLSYQDVEEELLKTIDEHDSDKVEKILEIKRWSYAYRYILDRYGIGTTLPFFKAILSDKKYWNGRKLDRKEIGLQLLKKTIKDASGNEVKNHMDDFSRYQISCWCCFKEHAYELFNQFKDKREREIFDPFSTGEPLPAQSIEMDKFVKILSSGKGALTVFWSYYFGNVEIRSEKNKNMDINEYGLECAIAEQFVEAINFFWNKLPEEKKNLDTLMKIAFYDSITGSATSDMILFCLNEIRGKKIFKFDNSEILYEEFLKKDYEKNGYYSILDKLMDDKDFKNSKRLFEHIEKNSITNETYGNLIYGILRKFSLLQSDSPFNRSIEDMLNVVWNSMNEHHKEHIFYDVCCQFSPIRYYIVRIIDQK